MMRTCQRWIVRSLSVAAMSVVALPASAQLGGIGLPSMPGGGGLPMGGFLDLPPTPPTPRAPSVRAPTLPLPAATPALLPTEGGLVRQTQALAGQTLSALHGQQVRALIRDHADLIDVDDQGQAVVRGEVLVLSPSAQTLVIARKAGFQVGEETRLEGLDLSTVTLSPPAGVSARDAVRRLKALDPQGQYDFNHIYLGAGAVTASARGPAARGGGSGVRVGLVDGGVAAHPSLGSVEQRGFAPGGLKVSAHGTAVASLMVGRSGAFRGAAPGARLLVADVYGGSPTGGSAAIIAQALAWMAQNKVPVINVSLVGPPNLTLQATVAALVARGHLVVAAVGNDGPAAPPLYPAAYPGVVSVTGVDARRRVLPEAGRGGHVDFAAPGADMAGASGQGGYVTLRGTSFAAPLVAGRLALNLPAPDRAGAARAMADLSRQATDLGARGADSVYGKGLVAFDLRTSPMAVGAGRALLAGE